MVLPRIIVEILEESTFLILVAVAVAVAWVSSLDIPLGDRLAFTVSACVRTT
jgi:hypothetical protein